MTEEKIKKIENCKYRLPCGWCDRLNDKCVFEQECEVTKPSKNQDNDFIKEVLDTQTETAICIHEWEPVNSINTAGYVYRCRKCGAMKTEPITRGLQEYITTSGNEEFNKKYSLWNSDSSSPCEHCPNNPKNGGSGVCHCILGLPKVTCTTLGTVTSVGPSSDYPFNMEPSCSTTQCTVDSCAGSTYTAGPSISTNKYDKNVKFNFNDEPQIFVTGMCTEEDLKNQPTSEELAKMTTVASTGPIIAHSNSPETIKTKKRKL